MKRRDFLQRSAIVVAGVVVAGRLLRYAGSIDFLADPDVALYAGAVFMRSGPTTLEWWNEQGHDSWTLRA